MGMDDQMVQALMGQGSPEEMEQMRRYQGMLKQYPQFAPGQPRISGADLGNAVSGLPGQVPSRTPGQMGGQYPGAQPNTGGQQMGPMQGQGAMSDEEILMQKLKQIGPGLRQLYGPR